MVFRMASSGHTHELLATRGDRLALFRTLLQSAGGDIGPTEAEWLSLVEVGEGGERVAGAMFDPDGLEAAYAELDDRYAAGEAAAYGAVRRDVRAFGRRSRLVIGMPWPRISRPTSS